MSKELKANQNQKLDNQELNDWLDSLDAVVENQFIAGKDPETDKGLLSGDRAEFGSSFSIICSGHQTRKSRVQLDNIRAGYKYGLYNE